MFWAFMILILIGADQISKILIVASEVKLRDIEVIKDFFYLSYVENRGASFGMLENFRWGFVVLTVVALIVMIRFLVKNKHLLLRLSLALLIAGATGNLIDRILKGYVVDFLHFYPFGYNFAVFNVADVAINIGVFFLFIYMLFVYKEPAKGKNPEQQSEQDDGVSVVSNEEPPEDGE